MYKKKKPDIMYDAMVMNGRDALFINKAFQSTQFSLNFDAWTLMTYDECTFCIRGGEF